NGTFRGSFTMLSDITEKKRIEDEFQREHLELLAAYEQITATEEELRKMLDELRAFQESLEESEERYRRIVSSTFDAMVIHREGKIAWANRRALEILGAADITEILGRDVLDFVHPDSRHTVRERVSRMAGDPNAVMPPVEEKFVRLDGSPVDVEVVATPIRERGNTAILVVFRDITERRRMQEALVNANRKLNILNTITRHDIQNKVTVLSGYIQLLKENLGKTDIARCFESVENALQTIRHIIEFTRNYQDLGIRAPEWQPLTDVIGRTAGQFELDGVALDIPDCSLEVFADPMLEKVFFTLFDNALRHGGGVSRIRVTCEKSGGDLLIRFGDNGIGIPADRKEKVFERGYGTGTGLGLFLSREILSITGLSIRECGVPGKGALFEIRVPEGLWRERLECGA
ncbi:MAG: PAS domain S-box protein, partial [Methanolinea sp.]